MKLNEFIKELSKREIDAAILINSESNPDYNVGYFSNVFVESYSCLLVKNSALLLVPSLEYEIAEKDSLVVVKRLKSSGFNDFVKKYVGKSKKIGLNFQNISLKRFNELKKLFKNKKFYDISDICKELRLIKNNEEINRIKTACKITDKVFDSYLKQYKKLKTEHDVVNFIKNKLYEFNSEPSFNPIVASSKNASMPHYEICNSRIKRGFCIIDVGAKYKNYCSDMTRTVFYGKANEKEKDLHNKVLEIQNNAIKIIKPDVKAKSLDLKIRKQLGNLSSLFIHGLGHGIGIQVHEAPSLNKSSKDILKENMVFTIEPGIYKKGKFGIRIEDTVLLEKNCKQLTKSKKELVELKI